MMIYILIVMWLGTSTGGAGKAAISVEFNDMQSCQAAAAEIRKQTKDEAYYNKIGALLCAQKGKP